MLTLRPYQQVVEDKFNDGISKLKADGTLNEMLKKYFGDNVMTFKN